MTEPAPSAISGAPLRVLVVPHLAELSGAPITAARIAARLDPARFTCRLVFPGPGPLADRMREQGVRTDILCLLPLSLRQARGAGRVSEWVASRRLYARQLGEILRNFGPHVAYIHSAVQLIPGLVAGRRRCPIVWHVQETLDLARPPNRLRRAVIKRLSRAVIFCGWTPCRVFGRRPEGRLWKVIPNALVDDAPPPPAARDDARRELQLPLDKNVLITVGGVHPRKGLDVLLEALGRRLESGQRDFTLLVAGGSSTAPPQFLRMIDELLDRRDLRSHVRLLGHRDDVSRLLAAADVFVLASRNEGLPLSLVEAFAAGLPSVVTDAGDCALLAGHGRRGVAVPRDDPAAFAGALDQLLRDPDLRRRMGTRARALARNRFRFSRFLRDVAETLDKAVAR